jgi:hypothetical protein
MKSRNAGTTARKGASTNAPISALRGLICSLKNSLSPSATVCRIPHGPARFGPIRLCMSESTLRSIHTLRTVTTNRSTNVARTRPRMIRKSMRSIYPSPFVVGCRAEITERR